MFEALGPIAELHMRFVEFLAQMRADLSLQVKSGIRDGSIPKGTPPPKEETALIVRALRGIAYHRRLDPDGVDPISALRYLAATNNHRLGGPVTSHLSQTALSLTACSTTLVEQL
jgi:hypothetical protein